MNLQRIAALHRQLAEIHWQLAAAFEEDADASNAAEPRPRRKPQRKPARVEGGVSDVDRQRAAEALRRAGIDVSRRL